MRNKNVAFGAFCNSIGDMTGPQLKHWRVSEGLSLREVAETYLDNQMTHTTLSRWENSTAEVPGWVEERLLQATRVTLPLKDINELIDLARARNVDFRILLAEAIRAYIYGPESPTQFSGLNQPVTPYVTDPNPKPPTPKKGKQ
jgi:transcriptional regulator with XRE-family HTH domain